MERGPALIEAAMDRDGNSSTPSTSTPSSSTGGVTFKAIMTQLQHMDACLDTLSDVLCQVNTRIGRIVWWQAHLGGFVESLSPSPEASEDKEVTPTLVMRRRMLALPVTTKWLLELLALMTKKWSSFRYESSHVLRGRISIGDFFVRGSVFFFWGK